MLPIRTLNDQTPLEASKWLKIQLLVDADEMRDLLASLGEFYIYSPSGVSPRGQGEMAHHAFLDKYTDYVHQLQKGQIPDESKYRAAFSSVFTSYPEALYALPVGEHQQVIRVQKPVVQLQMHRMNYSPLDNKFHTMVFGSDSISWGIQFSYPQLYRDPESKKVEPVHDNEQFPNTKLFKQIQKWIRQATTPTPFIIGDERMNVPVRLGKNCRSWINHHPQLVTKGLKVDVD